MIERATLERDRVDHIRGEVNFTCSHKLVVQRLNIKNTQLQWLKTKQSRTTDVALVLL